MCCSVSRSRRGKPSMERFMGNNYCLAQALPGHQPAPAGRAAALRRNTRNAWHCPGQGPAKPSLPSATNAGKSPLLLPPHLFGISPTQSGSLQCPLRSGLQPPAQGQPSTHRSYWHPQQWCRTGLPASHTPKSRLCVLLHSSVPSSPGCLCLKSRSLKHHPLLKGSHQARFCRAAQKPDCSPVKQSWYSTHSLRLRQAGGGAGTKPPSQS